MAKIHNSYKRIYICSRRWSWEFFKISYDNGNTDVTVAYAKDQDGKSKEPSKSAEYETMKTAVSNKTISIDFAAEIVVA